VLHKDVLRLLFPLELGGVFDDDIAIEGNHLDDAGTSAATLLDEMFPDEADGLLSSWERVTGVTPEAGDSLQTRRDRVVAQLRARGGLSREYFTGLAEALGHTVTIGAPRPFVCGVSVCGEELAAEEIVYLWQVTVDAAGPDAYLEALFRKLKPAWTGVEFIYTG
jgi:uncharacterized protein YmfQ (DUF2313 family)